MVCTNCGTESPQGQKFCGECGAALTVVCPACDAPNLPRQKFCGECGAALAPSAGSTVPTAPLPASEPPLSTERRLVSVLFSDLVDFTTLSESRDSEEVRDLLSRYFEACRGVISRYGGVVEKFIGDAVMAVWGSPVANEDDAERAVRAALDVVEAVAALGAEVGAAGLRARAGVLTGEATVNLGARGQGMVAGDLVNTASRLQSAAEPGCVLAGEATFHAARGAIAFEEVGALSLKGKAEPVTAFRALRVIGQRRGAGRAEGPEPPFVGRDEELRMLKELLHATSRERRARLVSVTGVPGIGKSRLASEFLNYVDGLAETVYWHQGRSPAYGEGISFWALGEMARMRARIAESEDPASARDKLAATVAEFLPDPGERRWVEPRLAHLLGLADAPPGEREELFSAWRCFFERIAEHGPVVMVFEDLQWADPGLIDFVESILEWSRSHPILVLTLARPELHDRRPTWGAGQRSFTSLHLEPLAESAMRALLAGLVPNLPADTVEAILTRAEGVPLYAVETVRMAADRGALVPEGGIYAIAGSFGELAVPETLQALIASRLDGLSAPERSLLGDAAVLGTTFTLASLSAVNGTDPARLEPLLRDLVRREILTVDADPRSPERGQYGFVQGLIREVAYGTLARSARRAKHLAAAHHFESLADEELAGVVAAHYSEAHRASPAGPEAEAVAARARDWLAQAGERATSLGSPEQALSFFEQALELTDSDLERAELSQRAGAMACRMGRVDDGLSLLERSAALFADGGLGHRAARVESQIAEVEFLQGHLERAIERMERAVTRMAGDEPDADLAAATGQLGRFLALAGRHQAAISRLEDALMLAEALQLPEVLSHGLNSRSLALDKLGRNEESTLLLEHALRIALEHDLGSAAVRAYNNLIVLLRDADRYQDAIDLIAPALALAERIGDRLFQVGFTTKSLVCHAMLGQWDEALARGAAAQELMSGLPMVWWGAMEIVELAPLHAHRGEFDRAHAILDSVRDETIDAPEYAASVGTVEAEVLLAEGRPREALVAAERALSVRSELGTTLLAMKRGISAAIEAAVALGDVERATEILGVVKELRPGALTPYLRAQAARLDARISATLGREDEAERGFEAAAGTLGEIHAPFLRAVTQLEHAEWLIQRGGGAEVRAGAVLGPARDTFDRLRATPWIERASRVGAGAQSAPIG